MSPDYAVISKRTINIEFDTVGCKFRDDIMCFYSYCNNLNIIIQSVALIQVVNHNVLIFIYYQTVLDIYYVCLHTMSYGNKHLLHV